jgi:hypothetical protein
MLLQRMVSFISLSKLSMHKRAHAFHAVATHVPIVMAITWFLMQHAHEMTKYLCRKRQATFARFQKMNQ